MHQSRPEVALEGSDDHQRGVVVCPSDSYAVSVIRQRLLQFPNLRTTVAGLEGMSFCSERRRGHPMADPGGCEAVPGKHFARVDFAADGNVGMAKDARRRNPMPRGDVLAERDHRL